jgi:thiamine biosynthesis protein ThiI
MFVAHYPELALKGRNRPWFVATLVRRLRERLAGLPVREVRAYKGHVEVMLHPGAESAAVAERLRTTFGLANFAPAIRCAPDLDAIVAAARLVLPDEAPASFRVRATRGDKRFPVPSPEIERRVGAAIHEARGWPVHLRAPALTVHVHVVAGAAFCTGAREAGAGGLPMGTGGKALALLSGGLDSPVAAWRVMSRGCRVAFIHFHSHPLTSQRSQEAVRAVVRRLARYQGPAALVLVPFADAQRHVVAHAPSSLRTLLYRRLMLRIADTLAPRLRASALVTGDVLGQVASQTVENLAAVEGVAGLPVLRPLVASDKEHIAAVARQLGTGAWSVAADEDCCAVFQPRQPATRARRATLEAVESDWDLAALVREALAGATSETCEADW